ncbi:MAG: plastocyanin [Acidobacteria bacterium]|nr:plastocyanin [Acidobacteriota bacterium]
MTRRHLFGAIAAAPLLAQNRTVEVSIQNRPKAAFDPATVNIKSGDTVEWTNAELITHTVDFEAPLPDGVKPFSSGDIEQDGTFKHTFTVKGEYKYSCKHHKNLGMTGTVVVT